MAKEKLRIGLLIETYNIPLWFYEMVKKIDKSCHSEIVLVVRKSSLSKKIFSLSYGSSLL